MTDVFFKRMAMISLLGQLGEPQDVVAGLHLIQHAADVADENAPQGPYVRIIKWRMAVKHC